MGRHKKKFKGDVTLEELNEGENPMTNSVVLSTIFKHCDVKDLKNFRLVCTLWYDSSLEEWRSKAILTVKRQQGKVLVLPGYFKKFRIGRDWRRAEDKIKYKRDADEVSIRNKDVSQLPPFFDLLPSLGSEENMFKLTTRPYSRFRVVGGFSSVEGGFWRKCGVWMKELYLDSSELTRVSCWKRILLEMTPNLRKLIVGGKAPREEGIILPSTWSSSHVNLKVLELRDNIWLKEFPILWTEFFMFFSKLEEIILPLKNSPEDDGERVETDFNAFLEAIKHVRSLSSSNLPITHLDLISSEKTGSLEVFPTSSLNLLEELGLSLKTLKVDIGINSTIEDIQRLMTLYASTLETLVVIKGNKCAASGIPTFPFCHVMIMTSLHTLKLVGPIITNLSFLRYTAHLKKLSIAGNSLCYKVGKHMTFVNGAEELNTLFQVKLLGLTEFESDIELKSGSDVKLLSGWMPKLEVLQVKVFQNGVFAEVCSQWKDTLQKLILIPGSYLNDDIITGIPYSKRKAEENTFQRGANITCLKNLKVFRMEKREICLSPGSSPGCEFLLRITDFSILHGFGKLPQLKILEIQVGTKMSEHGLETLKSNGVTSVMSAYKDFHNTIIPKGKKTENN